jgi:hypothetical protein
MGHIDAMDLLTALDKTRDETLRYHDLSDRELAATYAPSKWSVRFLLHHLADSEAVFSERLRKVLSEGKKVLNVYDQDAYALGMAYETLPLKLSRDIYSAMRAGNRHLAAKHYERDGHLEWIHSETGLRTLKMEFDKIANHNEHHLAQIRTALATLK